MHVRLFWFSSLVCLFLYDCGPGSRFAPKKADPTKGTVTGTVICADTSKPARFAKVELVAGPGNGSGGEHSTDMQEGVTDLDGKFRIEGVTPGEYFAFASLDGYLDPVYGIDFDKVNSKEGDTEQTADLIEQWKEHLVEVSVSAQRTSDITITMDRGAEISGTVSYDDGSAAIGMRFALSRKSAKGSWTGVGVPSGDFALEEKSTARGHYMITNLPAGEYAVCAFLPGDNQAASPQVCLGNVFRRRDAQTVTVGAGEAVNGEDIIIPLKEIHSVKGTLEQAIAGKPPSKARLRLLYADDREQAEAVDMFADGSFLFPFVAQGSYILEVTDASYSEPSGASGSQGGSAAEKVHRLVNREMLVTVDGDVSDLKLSLTEAPPAKPVQ